MLPSTTPNGWIPIHLIRIPGFFLLAAVLVIQACIPTASSKYASSEDVQVLQTNRANSARMANPCLASANYIPDTNYLAATPVRTILLNFHFMDNSQGTQNRKPEEARKFARDLVYYALKDLRDNQKMKLPIGNETPVLPTRLNYQIVGRPGNPNDDGIYFHRDDELFFYIHKGPKRNLFDRRVIVKYGVQLDTVLNIFIMPMHPDSIQPGKPVGGGVGVFLRNAIKINGPAETKDAAWKYRQVFNHEIGHALGLSHSWNTNDGCSDTPKHTNCWNYSRSEPCQEQVSNNVMDYNIFQHAWTPCQIGRMHQTISREGSSGRRFARRDWCTLDPEQTVTIRDTVEWFGQKDLHGDLVVESSGYLTIGCRVSLPKDARVRIQTGATLVLDGARLHNDCGDQWNGIIIEEVAGRKGMLILQNDAVLENVQNPIR